jgi:hypothetical protein
MRWLMLFIWFFLLRQSVTTAQVPVVWEPDLSMSGSLYKQWSWNTKFVVRVGLGQLGRNQELGAGNVLLSEAQGFINLRLIGGRGITLGLLYGLENPLEQDGNSEKRIIWQYSFRKRMGSISMSHRTRIEQRFLSEGFQHRLRYRVVAERPFSGDKIDAGEWYLILGTELLLSSDAALETMRFDNRSGVGVGMLFANEHRLQFELQHRAQRLFDYRYGSKLWMLTSWIVPL